MHTLAHLQQRFFVADCLGQALICRIRLLTCSEHKSRVENTRPLTSEHIG
jgi:hypothetical protein